MDSEDRVIGIGVMAYAPTIPKSLFGEEARACHPDKNPMDDEANAKFQKLANAYQASAASAFCLGCAEEKWQTSN